MVIADRVARRVNGLVAPCANYGSKSLLRAGGGPHFRGRIGLRRTTVIASVKDIIESFIIPGWRHIVVLDWHLENIPFVYEGVSKAIRFSQYIDEVKVVKIDNPNGLGIATDVGLEKSLFGDDFPGWGIEHASIWETSAMVAVFPDLVRKELIVDGIPPQPFNYEVLPSPSHGAPDSRVFWKVTMANREKGERILNVLIEDVTHVIIKGFPKSRY